MDLIQQLQQFQQIQDDINGLIATVAVVGVVSLPWLLILSGLISDGNSEREKSAKKLEFLEETVRLLTARVYDLEQRFDDFGVVEQIPADPMRDDRSSPPRTVRSAVEESIHEVASIEKWHAELIAVHGELSPAIEELFAAYRQQVKERRMTQLERDLAEMMGLEAVR